MKTKKSNCPKCEAAKPYALYCEDCMIAFTVRRSFEKKGDIKPRAKRSTGANK
jgi:hypothetical protein